MPEVFGIEGGGASGKDDPRAKKPGDKPASRGEPDMLYGSMDPRAGEGPQGRYVQYDNSSGAIMVNLPPEMSKWKHELEEDLMDEFYGEPAGAADANRTLDAWVKSWIERKEKEETDARPPLDA